MLRYSDREQVNLEAFTAQLDRLAQIYADIDRTYATVADCYGFQCTGCEDNCCLTRFHHHTHLEFLYLMKGYRNLSQPERLEIREKAASVCTANRRADLIGDGPRPRQMCPLNLGGRCRLYLQRPMICRMHGLPHQLQRPDGRILQGPGCAYFDCHCGNESAVLFDRTPFYREMAQLEGELRRILGGNANIKMTVAEMILAF